MPSRRLPTILVLVLSIDREPWRTIELEGQRRTWAAPESVPDGCRVVFYYGHPGARTQAARVAARLARLRGSSLPARALAHASRGALEDISIRSATAGARLAGDRLWTRVPEAYAFTLPKLLAALRWATSGALDPFDYVYRTNTSSYVNIERLRATAAVLPRTGCYAGWLGRPPETGPSFVKGAGILLSWDVAREVAGHRGPWSWGQTDDAAVGAFLAARGTDPIPLPRTLLRRPEDVAALAEEELRTSCQFRCKSHGAERQDHVTMATLHARLQRRAPG